MKTSALWVVVGVMSTCVHAGENANQTMRQKSMARITEAFPYQPSLAEPSSIADRKDAEGEVIMMKPVSVVERVDVRKLEMEMAIEGRKKEAEKNRHFSVWRGGGIIYEGRLGKARFAFGVVGPMPFIGLSW